MFLSFFDLGLILILFTFIAVGFASGFVQALGTLIGFFIGIWVAGRYHDEVSGFLQRWIKSEHIAGLISFFLIFAVVGRVIGYLFVVINKVFRLASLVPFVKTVNRIFGGFLGLVEGLLTIGLVLYVINRTDYFPRLQEWISESDFALWLILIIKLLMPLMPAFIKSYL